MMTMIAFWRCLGWVAAVWVVISFLFVLFWALLFRGIDPHESESDWEEGQSAPRKGAKTQRVGDDDDWEDAACESEPAETPGLICSRCGYEMDLSSGIFGAEGATPNTGDVSICIKCGKLSVFNDDLKLREPTAAEFALFTEDERITRAQIACAAIVP